MVSLQVRSEKEVSISPGVVTYFLFVGLVNPSLIVGEIAMVNLFLRKRDLR